MRAFATVMAAAALAQTAMAHYRFNKLIVNDDVTAEYEYVRQNSNMNSPVTDVTSKDLICNAGGLDTGAQTSTYKVAPGDTLGFTVDTPIQHPGPLQVYMSKAADGDASKYDGSGDWFKIFDMGANTYKAGDNGLTFKADKLDKVTFTLPEQTPPGQYLLRIEHIGLHSASSFGGAQFYISCAQIEVSGSSTAKPSPTVKIPGVYTGHEDDIMLSIYYPIPENYQPPGPAVWPAGAGSAPATSAAASTKPAASTSKAATSAVASSKPASSAFASSKPVSSAASSVVSKAPVTTQPTATTLSTIVKTSTSAAPPATSAASGSGTAAAKYAQCGGKNWTGATTCVSGSTCKVQNDWYSQCI